MIGADIHIFGDGAPVYLLEGWRPPPPLDSGWLIDLPSRMLNAHHEVVPFTGRAVELEDLHQWRRRGPRLAVRWLHGLGGQGKTRLANKFATDTAAAGWKVARAVHGPGAVLPPPGSQDLRLEGFAGLLLIIDYADQWPLSHLTWLLSNAVLHQTRVPARILMLARDDQAWPAVRASLANLQAGTSGQRLEQLPDGDEQRGEMFAAGRNRFAALYEITDPSGITPPGSIDHGDFGLTLALHMAALVAVDGHKSGGQPRSTDLAGLTIYLLDREHLHWARLYGDSTHELDPESRTYRTPPEVMNQAVFAGALTGPVQPTAGAAILDGFKLGGSSDQVLADHAVCYPPVAAGTVLEPLYPDRLAEDFVALTLPGHAADYPAQGWGGDAARRLLAGDGDAGALPQWTPRALTLLATAAQRWRHVGETHLYPVLIRAPELAVEAGGAALTALASIDRDEVAVLEAIEPHLPHGRHVELDPAIAAIARRLTKVRQAQTQDRSVHAQLQASLSTRLRNAGYREDAVMASREAVDLYRQLAITSSEAFDSELASALSNLGNCLLDVGRREEALAATGEAVEVSRRLAASSPGPSSNLVASLVSHVASLLNLGRIDEALAATAEAIEVCRRLVPIDQAAAEPHLVMSLNHLSTILMHLHRPDEALVAITEAVQVSRQLALSNPAEFEPHLVMSLNYLSSWLISLGRLHAGLAATSEAVAVSRRLASSNPVAFETDLGVSLLSLDALRMEQDSSEDELAATQEAVDIYRRLAEANPAAFEHHLAVSLNNLAVGLSLLGRRKAALAATQEAVMIFRRLAANSPEAFDVNLAAALLSLGGSLWNLGRRREGLAATEEAVEVCRGLAATKLVVFGPNLADSLGRLGTMLSGLGRRKEALAAHLEAVEVYRRLAAIDSATFEHGLASSLNNVAASLSNLARPEEALTAIEEVVEIRRRLVATDPAATGPERARPLRNLGPSGRQFLYAASGPHAELAMSLRNLGASLSNLSRHEEARAAMQEAVEVYRRLTATDPAAFAPYVAAVESDLRRVVRHLKAPESEHHRLKASKLVPVATFSAVLLLEYLDVIHLSWYLVIPIGIVVAFIASALVSKIDFSPRRR